MNQDGVNNNQVFAIDMMNQGANANSKNINPMSMHSKVNLEQDNKTEDRSRAENQ